ncbi:enoyl-CoA hydratase-related protein [Oceanobacillus luteolus]|uniref:enoyl-CoA hydratase/isomerase family protein n=1 Tax=Oceanobacillus luteolus TaxID=1274358 RepID=UPI00203BE58B|nr:enoyl-CoA hydratase-related protein [Oceanobacillus luteolus]MCM3740564.1 enoyl-CoA hydratase-related protein [Oceanobacillus luteolus]
MTDKLYVERDGAIASIIINRPEKKNCFSLAMFQRLEELLDELRNDDSVKLLIVRGVDETAFSAGADITEFLEVRLHAEKAKAYNDFALGAIEKLYRFPRPTIAMIQTLAIGGGLELANACDFRFATSGSKVGITSANIGIVYNLSSTKRLYNLIGPSKTKEMLYTAKLISAEEGQKIGLIDYVCEPEEIENEVDAFARRILTKSPVANSGIKQVIQAIIDGENTETEALSNMILESYSSDDYLEGIQAFMEKRKPIFLKEE